MPNEREFVLRLATGHRLPNWLRGWLVITTVIAGAVLFWFGLFVALVALLAAVVALLPLWAWRLFRADRRSRGPATIEGECTIVMPSTVGGGDEARDWNQTGDAGHQRGQW